MVVLCVGLLKIFKVSTEVRKKSSIRSSRRREVVTYASDEAANPRSRSV